MKILSEKAIRKAIRALQTLPETTEMTFIVPKYKRVLSRRYLGKGRPKKIDYDYVEIDYSLLSPK